MKVQGFVTTTCFCVLALSGCAQSADDTNLDLEIDEDAVEFRGGPLGAEFWEWGLNKAANGTIEVHEGEDVDVPDCLIWDIDIQTVARQVEPGVFTDLLSVDDDEIYGIDPLTGTANAAASCTAEEAGAWWNPSFKLRQADGQVAITVWHRFVFIGDVDMPPIGSADFVDLLLNHVAFSFKHDHIYDGPWWEGMVIATADANLNKANPMRRLLLGGLVAGECGSAGLP